jgi:hypothetical protein
VNLDQDFASSSLRKHPLANLQDVRFAVSRNFDCSHHISPKKDIENKKAVGMKIRTAFLHQAH